MERLAKILTLAAFSLLASACEEATEGPCVHFNSDPILIVTNAVDLDTGTPVDSLLLDSIRVNNYRPPIANLARLEGPRTDSLSYGVDTADGRIICTLPFALAGDEGVYELWINTPGYRDTMIAVAAEFATVEGGCPSSSSGGTVVSIGLRRE